MNIFKITMLIAAFCMLAGNAKCADTPTPEELCRQRNAASCEINGLKFFIEDDCPKGAKILRAKGNENCNPAAGSMVTESIGQSDTVAQPSTTSAAIETKSPESEASPGSFGGAYLFILAIGLLQGVISRAAPGPLLVVFVVMPLIASWGMLSAEHIVSGTGEYWLHAGRVLLEILLCSMAGWGIGMVIRVVVLKLPFR